MFIDQSFVLIFIFDDQAKIIEADDEPFDLLPCGDLNDHGDPLLAHPVEKLVLNIDLIFHHYGPLSIDGVLDARGIGSLPA
jgi:hypothetical protein